MQSEVAVLADNSAPLLLRRGQEKQLTTSIETEERVQAPVEKGQQVGVFRVMLDAKTIAEIPIRAAEAVEKMTVFRALGRLLRALTR